MKWIDFIEGLNDGFFYLVGVATFGVFIFAVYAGFREIILHVRLVLV